MQSTISLQSKYLWARRVFRKNRFFISLDELFSNICIENPAQAIDIVFDHGPLLPSESAIKRYANYSDRLMSEIITVAWRYLAVTQPNKTERVSGAIIDHIRRYLEAQGLYEGDSGFFSERTLSNLATKIVAQWRRGNMLDSALLNSTPAKKPK